MRTLRKAFCILILAVLVTSTATLATPAGHSDRGESIGSWARLVLDSIVAFLLPDEVGGNIEPDGTGSVLEPGATLQSLNGEDGDEFGGGVDPHG